MDRLINLYYKSTDPDTKYVDLIDTNTLISIILHTWLYFYFITHTSSVFNFPINNNKLIYTLLFIMIFGYIGRLYRAKLLFKKLKNKSEVRKIMDSIYQVWYFIG